jgi:hypothetical protein
VSRFASALSSSGALPGQFRVEEVASEHLIAFCVVALRLSSSPYGSRTASGSSLFGNDSFVVTRLNGPHELLAGGSRRGLAAHAPCSVLLGESSSPEDRLLAS